MCPAQGKRSIGTGTSVSMTSFRGIRALTTLAVATAAGPTSAASATSRLASVAERPQVASPGARVRRRASANSVCTPRFVASSSCHSSTITVSRSAKRSWAFSSERRTESDSGVVTSPSGQRFRSRLRSAAVESPVRSATCQCGARRRDDDAGPLSAPESQSARSGRGRSSDRRVSAASARSGVIQTTRGPLPTGRSSTSPASSRAIARRRLWARAPSQAARVLPVPVGACTNPLPPAAAARHTCS